MQTFNKKFVAGALCLLIFLVPNASILAQEVQPSADSTSPPSDTSSVEAGTTGPDSLFSSDALGGTPDSSTADTDQSTPPAETAETASEPAALDDSQSGADELGSDVPQLSLMSGGSSASSQYPLSSSYQPPTPQIDKATGALVQRIPLQIPPGRKGLQPDLALEYNSQRTANDSIVGYGWSLSIPYIERLNKTGTERLYEDNYFTSSIGGELATTSTSTPTEYRLKVEDGTFVRYNFDGSVWTAYDKDGTRYSFGTTSQSRLYATSTPDHVYRWMLEEIRDTNDNFVRFEYTADGNQLYPSKIYYTGHGSTDGVLEIDFTKSSRPDPITSYRGGIKVVTHYYITQIKALVNGEWVRQYDLSYTTGHNGARSLLQSVQETGRNSATSATLQLPALTLQYWNASTTIFAKPGSSLTGGQDVLNNAYVVSDTNGDGLNDVNVSYIDGTDSNHPKAHIWKNNGGTSQTQLDYNYPTSPFPVTWSRNNAGSGPSFLFADGSYRVFDVDGDGRADMIQSLRNNDGNASTTFYRNNYSATTSTYAWSQASTTGTVPYFQYADNGSSYSLNTGIVGNLNGDSLSDYTAYLSTFLGPASYLGLGSGWTAATTTAFVPVQRMPDETGSPASNSQLIDINGDGLDDWVYADGSSTYVKLNTGTGWESSASDQWTIATSTYSQITSPYTTYWDRGARFLDINGDGLPDFVRSYKIRTYTGNFPGSAAPSTEDIKWVFLNTGSGWATSTAEAAMLPAYIMTDDYNSLGGNTWSNDYASYDEYANWGGLGQHQQDVLTQISYPKGGSAQVQYSETAKTGASPELPYSYLVVSRINLNDRTGVSQQTDYTYDRGQLYNAQGPREQKFAGFSTITETKQSSITKTYYSQGDTASTTVGEQVDGFAYIGRPYRTDITTASGQLVSRAFYRYDTIDQGNGRTYLYKSRQLEQDFANAGAHKDKATEYAYATSTGDVIRMVELGEVTGASDGTYSDTASDSRTTLFAYATSSATNLSVPTHKIIGDNASTTAQETHFYYDSLALGSVGAGNPTKTEQWISGGSYASTTKSYNNYGLATSERDANGNQTTYSYDSYNLYPATKTNALTQATTYTYDYATGQVIQTTDPNSLSTKTLYDPVGRPSEMDVPDFVTPSSLVAKKTFAYTDNTFPAYAKTTTVLNSATSSDVYEFFDGLGRTIQKRIQAGGTNTFSVEDSVYNTDGLLQKASLPYFASSTSYSAATSTPQLFTSYTYDPLERVLTAVNSVGTTTTSHGAWATSKTDPRNNTTTYRNDAFGNLIEVTEPISPVFPATGLIGYWKLDESSGSAADSSGNGYTLLNTGTTAYASSLINNGADFGSANTTKMLSVASNLGVDGGAVSLSGWVRVNTALSGSTNASYQLLTLQSMQTGTTNTVYQIYYDYNGGSPRLEFGRKTPGTPGNDHEAFYSTTLGTGTWYHVALTYDGTTLRGYLNGSEVGSTDASGSGTGFNLTNCFQIGTRGDNNSVNAGNAASVDMDEVGAWNRALGEGEVQAIVNSGAGFQYGSSPASNGVTSYTYDATNNLTKITDALSNVRNFTYDGISRRTAAEDLHPLASATFGTTTYAYDPAGNVTSKVTPNAVTVEQTYDALNRPLTENDTGMAGTEITYTYDSCTNGIGHLCVASTTASRLVVAFNALGLPATETKTIAGTAYSTTYSYDRQGNPTEIVYPDSTDVLYLYDDPGRIQTVSVKTPGGSTFSPVVTGITYAPTGAVSTRKLVSGLRSIYTYDDRALYRLARLETVNDLNPIQANTAPVYASGLVAYWKLDGNSNDAAGSNNGTDHSITYNTGNGKISQGAGIGSSASYIDLGTGSSLDITGALTISAWVKVPDCSQYRWILSRGVGNLTSQADYEFRLQSGTCKLEFYAPGGGAVSSSAVSTGSFVHVAVTRDASCNLTFYINGTSAGTGTCSGPTSQSANAYIGARQDFFNYFNGSIDEVAVLNRAWSSSEVATVNNSGIGYEYPAGGAIGSLQSSAFTYDANGNITSITDTSTSDTYKTVAFSYDPVNRLLSASTTVASTSPYTQGFTYNAIGNITARTGTSSASYTYAGANYANPHAPTSIGGTSLSYDHAGNVTGYGAISYTWDWRNRMANFVNGGATSTYAYDSGDARILGQFTRLLGGATTTTATAYPSHYFSMATTTVGTSTANATSTSFIYAGDVLVATVESVFAGGVATGTAVTRHSIPDYLNSTSFVTDASGNVLQTLDYYPYGGQRINSGSYNSSRQYIGERADADSGLDYLNARYYDASRGQFLSQDPVFWEIAQSADGKAALNNPQSMNSYSYAESNPILKRDADGRFVPQAVSLGALYGGVAGAALQGYVDFQSGNVSGLGTYGAAFARGAIVGAAAVVNPYFGASAAAGTSLGQQYALNRSITYNDAVNATTDGLATGLTAGFLKGLPGVPGAQASKILDGGFFSGAHGIRYAHEAAFGFGADIYSKNVQSISQQILNFYSPRATVNGPNGAGGISQLSQSVIKYANTPGANLRDVGFVAGVRAINDYNNSLMLSSNKQ